MLGQKLGNQLVVARGARMLGCFYRQTAREEPPGSAAMNLNGRVGVVDRKPKAGELGKQRVDTEPASVLEPNDEQVGAAELRQHRRRVATIEYGIAQLGSEAAEHRGPEQEGTNVGTE